MHSGSKERNGAGILSCRRESCAAIILFTQSPIVYNKINIHYFDRGFLYAERGADYDRRGD